MSIRQIQKSREQYGIEDWGAGYFTIDDEGQICCHPTGKDHQGVQLSEIMASLDTSSIHTPVILRFPQIIRAQIERMHSAFTEAIWEYNYTGKHLGVFPFKVNQRREFIDSIVAAGTDNDWGLEVGSKTELLAAMSYPLTKNSLLICNGFKDYEFIEIAFVAKAMGHNVIIVLEGPDELDAYIKESKKHPRSLCPQIGFRVRLYSKGSGKWAKSSGETSKFGLSTIELLHCLKILREENLSTCMTMLHFHIGSQITAIKRFKNALKEAARVYSKVTRLGFTPAYLDIGGGVGVDYDGSKTSAQSSANYSLQEFANDAVYVIGEVCKNEEVPCPSIVTEAGRVIAAYHSVVITDIREIQGEEESELINQLAIPEVDETAHKGIRELKYIHENINKKNFGEFYHDAIEYHEELFTLFNLGYISLEERAIAENLFHTICRKALYFSSFQKHQSDEFITLQKQEVSKYLANFSIFQSIPDAWAIDQLFPVIPLTRHEETPSHKATIVDITCDSDGCIEKFVDRTDDKSALDLHSQNGKPYWIGFFLVGAYQESLANEHNLFGAIHEIEVEINDENEWTKTKVTQGDPISELLTSRNYDIGDITDNYKMLLESSMKQGILEQKEMVNLLKKLDSYIHAYPYLRCSKDG